MKITRVLSLLFASFVFFLVTTMPLQAANNPLSKVGANKSVIPPVGSYDPAGKIGMAAEAVGKSQFADIYGGMALVDQGTHVNIYLTKADPVAERAIQGSAPAEDFTFILIPHNEKQMLEIHQKVTDEARWILSNGINLVSWGPDVKIGKELIKVKGLTSEVTDYLTGVFGSNNIEVQNVDHMLIPLANRSSDAAPWNGGDFISDYVNGDCTSGFGAYASSTNYLITAAHCFPLGNTVYNGSMNFSLGSTATMGTVTSRDTNDNGVDAELINTSSYGGSSDLVWAGSSTSPTADVVSGATTSPVGYQVCQSGAFEGEICGLTIQSNNFCANDGGRIACHLVEAANTSGGIAVGAGDSGGPVFRFNGSYLYATGIVTAGDDAYPVPCSSYTNGRSCYSSLIYTDINSILSDLGVALK